MSDAASFEFEALPHRPHLFAHAMRMSRNRDDAEDLVQDTFARAFAAWERYVPGSNCRAWLMRILTHSFINNYRKRRRHRRFAEDTGNDAVLALYGNDVRRSNEPAAEMVEGTLGDEVTEALDGLSPDYRAVVERADLRGARYREVADELGVPIGTVMSRLYRARRQLETELAVFAAEEYGITRAA